MSSEKKPTRERILKAAWQLLEAGEGAGVRMADIAKAANVSRQALYLHFPNRADLLVETTRYLDRVYDMEARLVASRTASSGAERLDAWVEAWGNYIPKIYGIAKALLAAKDSDEEASNAWDDRMEAVREGCAAAIAAIVKDGKLRDGLTATEATDMLAMLVSVRSWEALCVDAGWAQDRYISGMQQTARRALVQS